DCDEPTLGVEHTVGLGKRLGPLDEVDDELHERPLKPAVLEGQPFCWGNLDGAQAFPGERRHLRGGLDPPYPGATLCESRRRATGATADVEQAAADEVAFANHDLEQLVPVGVGGRESLGHPSPA